MSQAKPLSVLKVYYKDEHNHISWLICKLAIISSPVWMGEMTSRETKKLT